MPAALKAKRKKDLPLKGGSAVVLPTKRKSKSLGLEKAKVNKCANLFETSTTVDDAQFASVSLDKINSILHDSKEEVGEGVLVAPLFRGCWGACASIEILPGKSHGPHINTAEFLVGRVFGVDSNTSDYGVTIQIGNEKEKHLQKNEYFQISRGTAYFLHNKNAKQSVTLSIQVFENS